MKKIPLLAAAIVLIMLAQLSIAQAAFAVRKFDFGFDVHWAKPHTTYKLKNVDVTVKVEISHTFWPGDPPEIITAVVPVREIPRHGIDVGPLKSHVILREITVGGKMVVVRTRDNQTKEVAVTIDDTVINYRSSLIHKLINYDLKFKSANSRAVADGQLHVTQWFNSWDLAGIYFVFDGDQLDKLFD
ncbi:MAG: hypothetical protein COZ46_02960 [Verrucomicrobia bacterium CG_4_10_14_3_um_filter_43_23]|nr:MAG: hypothetical protein AUJ82_01025 [Verrucomicrobia bacterium CG1_02_43_26]PIP59479.1 MAG: hypothetical protein COX01_02585 [Verrucomicrobia bacterium CG22_combo_CG10-13_8_21_14_all_43_17]PIX58640.1 MAG: hypothetical protein COZ46_02960 [Verrucomicrobia bacterium CG_4_10_14_3_um_filter_43_23]PIY61465.1 MAG: hypothetical protein COY94_05325 [Verrucomicrobia bacterium CG_4_10_14_0_8_um_filter_43_34]PJA43832.1 MAG: hypothetical protein CO175_06245 [Verrucomicrobia bacterium CG_4_9_14_3_um_fi